MNSATLNLLSVNKLNGDNYTSWKNTINTILIIDVLQFVLLKECSQVSAQNASQNAQDADERWAKANEKARAYILANLYEVLAKMHESMVTANEIMEAMFGQSSL
ncbi:uncharacterized protein LOC120084595 [Benincasa hispida]|uniref:uncharacterized protein LOC120084595 n=1 Tax=Benincasa hispida TaxID=102211 RepID=UPI001901183E|nr:uncharacterized protein LOC120084595 [Benincasa hispida]